MKLTVFDVANWFTKQEAMSLSKLMGLVYLSYAWFYTLNDKELFITEGFEAMPIFPVEKELFHKYKNYGNKKIKTTMPVNLSSNYQEFLQSVYDTYAIIDGDGLAAYLRTSTPYLKAREQQTRISKKDMKEYYETQQD